MALPPAHTALSNGLENRLGFFYHILPCMEQENLYHQFHPKLPGDHSVNLATATSDEASIPTFHCPTRRSGINQSEPIPPGNCSSPGATGDYSVVV